MARSGLNKMEFRCRTHWTSVVARLIMAFGLSVLAMVVVAILRRHCTNISPLIPLVLLIGINIHAIYTTSRNKYSVTNSHLIVEEYYFLRKREVINIPITLIDSCVLSGLKPYQSIKISVHGHPYTLRHVRNAAELVSVINDKMNM